jgi:hypothetical protein
MSRELRIVYLSHEGGTKDYHLIVGIDDENPDEGFALKRFGKVGSKGQTNKAVGRTAGSVAHANRELSKRAKRGYKVEFNEVYTANTIAFMDSIKTRLSQGLIMDLSAWLEADRSPVYASDDAFSGLADIERGEEWGSW